MTKVAGKVNRFAKVDIIFKKLIKITLFSYDFHPISTCKYVYQQDKI